MTSREVAYFEKPAVENVRFFDLSLFVRAYSGFDHLFV